MVKLRKERWSVFIRNTPKRSNLEFVQLCLGPSIYTSIDLISNKECVAFLLCIPCVQFILSDSCVCYNVFFKLRRRHGYTSVFHVVSLRHVRYILTEKPGTSDVFLPIPN